MSDTVTIGRFDSAYYVPDLHPDPERVRWQLDRVLRRDLPAACGQALQSGLAQPDDAIWLIRRLNVEIALDVSAFDEPQIAQAWGEALAGRIVHAIAAGGDDVLYFPDPPAYLAQFLVDLAGGAAWNKWYYEDFAGLRELPESAAAREALLRDLGIGIAALDQLGASHRLERLLAILSIADARRLFAAILQIDSTPPTRASVTAALAIWHSLPLMDRDHDALRLLATLGGSTPGAARTVELLIRLAALPHSLSLPLDSELLADLPAPTRAALATLIALADDDRDWLIEVVTTVTGTAATPDQMTQTIPTAYGGAALLLAALLADGLDRALEIVDPANAALLRLVVLAKGVGDPGALDDPVVQLIAGVASAPTGDDLAALNDLDAETLLAALIERLYAAGRASGRGVRLERLDYRDQPFVLLRDLDADAWLAAPSPDRVDAALAALQTLTGSPGYQYGSGDPPPELSAVIARFEARAKPASSELDTFPPLPILDPSLDFALTLFARAALRGFAARLIGFEWSSAAYLRDRFLTGVGVVELTPDAITVRLATSPLRIIMQMAGIDGETLTLPWLPATPIYLRLT